MSLGPIMLDLAGPELLPAERELLLHPLVGGVILFTRNYENPAQLAQLVNRIHGLREPRILVAVDHEGGRVQRFRESFTKLPAPAHFGKIYNRDPVRAQKLVNLCGWVLALELGAMKVDFSFAPVLDLARGRSTVIGDRAFHDHPAVVAELGRSFMRGMRQGGMVAVGKHFPGHGAVVADSHFTTPVDARALETIRLEDMLAFERMIHYGLSAVMPAHVIYQQVDERPAGFSDVWLRSILRGQLGFQGAVFSDDISMAGAAQVGDYIARASAALAAGCDMVLVCNDRAGAVSILDGLKPHDDPVARTRLARMHGHQTLGRESLMASMAYKEAARTISALDSEPELDLRDDTPV